MFVFQIAFQRDEKGEYQECVNVVADSWVNVAARAEEYAKEKGLALSSISHEGVVI